MTFNNNKGEVAFPFAIVDVDEQTNAQLLKDFTGERTGFVQVGPKKYFFPQAFRQSASNFYNFEARSNDIWVATFPRSGTTWTQELVWMIANNLNYAEAKEIPLTQRFPFFEFNIFMHAEVKQELLDEFVGDTQKQEFIETISTPGYVYLPLMKTQRFIKTHLPFSLMPPSVMENQAKIIYVARNPKDVAVSFYHLNKLYRTQGFQGDFKTYWKYFESNLNPWLPYWSHVKEGWMNRHHPNVLFMFYEDINMDLRGTIRKVASFLDKSLGEEEIEQLHTYLSIENFKNNKSVNQCEMKEVNIISAQKEGFVRNGKCTVNGWQKEYEPHMIPHVEKWIADNLSDTDLRFPC